MATTPTGMFSTFRTVDGLVTDSLGTLWMPRFFYQGYAIHGDTDVPPVPGVTRLCRGSATRPSNGSGRPISTRSERRSGSTTPSPGSGPAMGYTKGLHEVGRRRLGLSAAGRRLGLVQRRTDRRGRRLPSWWTRCSIFASRPRCWSRCGPRPRPAAASPRWSTRTPTATTATATPSWAGRRSSRPPCAEEMLQLPPAGMAALLRSADSLGAAGQFVQRIFSPFSFEDVPLAPPTRTFERQLDLQVGGRPVSLIEVGPAHTDGDAIVWLADEGIVFTGDILFHGGHPIVWSGPVANWIAACDRVLALRPTTVVPGHGPLATPAALVDLKGYFELLTREARTRFDGGMTPLEAARDIDLGPYAGWTEAERVVANVHALYLDFGDRHPPTRCVSWVRWPPGRLTSPGPASLASDDYGAAPRGTHPRWRRARRP